MTEGLIVVRKANIAVVDTVTLPSWVSQFGVDTDGKDGEVVAYITPRFEQETWELTRGSGIWVLDLNCVSESGARLHDDDSAEVIILMSEVQRAGTRVIIRHKNC